MDVGRSRFENRRRMGLSSSYEWSVIAFNNNLYSVCDILNN
jgi:hypothetical protein